MKVTSNYLPNYGYIKTKLPNKLYKALLSECLNARNNTKHKTALSSDGTPEHFYVEKNYESLINFVKKMHVEYDKHFPGISDIRVLTANLPFAYGRPWINIQKQNEFIPIHTHGGVLSYNIWIKIPYNGNDDPYLGNFTFVYSDIRGNIVDKIMKLSSKDEGVMMMFPSKLNHLVWPFHNNKQDRISIAGNILLEVTKENQ